MTSEAICRLPRWSGMKRFRAPFFGLLLVGTVAAAGACHKEPEAQNITIDNGLDPNADIEAVPADETSGTPADQLSDGDDNADVADLNSAD